MKLAQITEKSAKELDQLIADQRQALAALVIDMHTKKVTNVKEISSIKRTIARALTLKRQHEITAAETTDNKHSEGDTNG